MGPHEINETAELIDDLLDILSAAGKVSTVLEYGQDSTDRFRESLAKLRTNLHKLNANFHSSHFPLVSEALGDFSENFTAYLQLFPGNIEELQKQTYNLKSAWQIMVRPQIYALELALAISPGVYLPEDSAIYQGKDRQLREIALEINITYRHGAYNSCSVLLRKLLETLIIKLYTKTGQAQLAQNTAGEFYQLGKLIDDVTANSAFGLSRNAYNAMPELKRLGDWGAHNPNAMVRFMDLEDVKVMARLCFEELLAKL